MVRDMAKEGFWRGQMEAQRSSGLSVRGYCLREGIKEPSFHAWRRELTRRDGEKSSSATSGSENPPRFVALHAPAPGTAPASTSGTGVIEILIGAATVRVHGVVEASSLRSVLEALCTQVPAC